MSRILIVEDEKKITRFLELELTHEGYEVQTAGDGRSGLEQAQSWQPDLLILDLMLPELSGIEVCRRLRHDSDVPIIMLTAKDDVSDKVMGLDMGADDYMTKPFAIEELLARIRVGLKKRRSSAAETPAPASNVLQAGGLVLEPSSYTVTMNNQPINLTKKEFDLLKYLMSHKGEAVTRDALLTDVWGYDYAGDTNVVDVYIRYLRHKIDEPFGVKTVVSLNPIMVDGTGMCGGCRVTVGGEVKFACVDGPDFDGHKVDYDELMSRNSVYREREAEERKTHICRIQKMGEELIK